MKSVTPAMLVAATLFSGAAFAADSDPDMIAAFVKEAYPRITSYAPMQKPGTLKSRLRLFSTQEAFDTYNESRNADGTLDFVFSKGGMVMDDIISKISVYDRKRGEWKAEFVARHKSLGPGVEEAECISVTVIVQELPLVAGMGEAGIESVESRPSKVTCPQD